MRVYEPKKRVIKKRRRYLPKIILIVVLAGLLFILINHIFSKPAGEQNSKQTSEQSSEISEPEKTGELKIFKPQEFMALYDNIALPNTQLISENTSITGNLKADKKIIDLALKRGYKWRSAPITDTFKKVDYGLLLQQKASEDWFTLKADAKKEGIDLGLTSAYRSADDARSIFMQAISSKGIDINSISSGAYDSQINEVLKTVAPPGFSRHHSGYTVDISCISEAGLFENTTCFKWLSKDNYKNAKLHGWIPSYPDGIKNQGPDPEAWEYIWVGKDSLTK